MGTGTDVAMESAGVTLVKGPARDRRARLEPRDDANIRQNLFSVRLQCIGVRSPPVCCIRSSVAAVPVIAPRHELHSVS